MAPRKGVVYCKDVASKLGIKPHVCKRKYYLEAKNRARHLLKSYSLNDPHHGPILRRLFSIHPLVRRSTRTPINERIENLFGARDFEICNKLEM